MARSRSSTKERALVAAAERVQIDDAKAVKLQLSRRSEWQNDAWDYFDLVPEVKQLTWLLGNMLAKLRLFVAVNDPNDDQAAPIPVTDPKSGVPPAVAQLAVDELARLGSGVGGHSEILRSLNMNLEIAAEGWLIGRSARDEVVDDNGTVTQEATDETWEIKSIKEVQQKRTRLDGDRTSEVIVLSDPGDKKGTPLDPDLDTFIRFWQRHPAWGNRADCAMRGVLDDCETLLVLKQQLRAESRSHIPAGFLFAANDLEWAVANPAQQQTDSDDGEALQHPLMRQLVTTLTEAIEDPSAAGSLAPMLGLLPVGQGERIADKVLHMSLARTTSDTLDSRIEKRVDTLARGLNAPPELMMGHQQTTFANAEQIDEDTFDDHLEPRALLIVDVATIGFFRPNLRDVLEPDVPPAPDNGAPPPPVVEGDTTAPDGLAEWIDKMFVWFDPAGVIHQPDQTKHADEAHKNGTISDSTYRRVFGFGEDDAPSVEELLVRIALQNGQLSPEITVALLQLLGQSIDVQPLPDSSSPAAAIRKALATTSRPVVAASTRRPLGTSGGRRFMEIDRDLRSRLLVLTDRTMTRALERAGNVMRSKAPAGVRRELAGVAPLDVGRQLGRAVAAASGADVDAILRESIDTMEATFLAWGEGAQRQALNLASRAAAGFTKVQREAFELRQAADLTEAWTWMRETLTSLARAQLFDPVAVVQVMGEADASLSVSAGIVRQSITRAGGIAGVQTNGGDGAWIALTDAGARPAGGIGTGELVTGALAEGGVVHDGYVWDYGPGVRTRPFEPHEALDGVEFSNFDDAVLANDEAWPEFAFFMPGDHDGCLCDFVPVLAESSTSTTAAPAEEP